MIAPWTFVWQRNVFAVWFPYLGVWMSNAYVRGAVSGVGIVTTFAGLRDLTGAFVSGPRRVPDPPGDQPAPTA